MIRLLLTLALGASLLPAQLYPPAPGQKPLSWVTVTANPSGACVQTTQGQLNVVNGTAWACVTGNASLINGTWTQVSGAGGNATTVNGASVPSSQPCLGSNAGSQLIPCGGVIDARSYMKLDGRVVWDAVITNTSNVVTCADCHFLTNAVVGQTVFATNVSPFGYTFQNTSVIILPQGTISSIDSDTQITASLAATASSVVDSAHAGGVLVWGTIDNTGAAAAWAATVSSCSVLEFPALNNNGTGPAIALVSQAQFNTATATGIGTNATCSLGTEGQRRGIGIEGKLMNGTTIIPVPSFDPTTCVYGQSAGACFFSVADGLNLSNMVLWGAGSSALTGFSLKVAVEVNPKALLNTSTSGNNQITNFTLMGWGAGATGLGTGIKFDGGSADGIVNLMEDGVGNVGCDVTAPYTFTNLKCVDNYSVDFYVRAGGTGAVWSYGGVYGGTTRNGACAVSVFGTLHSFGDNIGDHLQGANGLCVGYANFDGTNSHHAATAFLTGTIADVTGSGAAGATLCGSSAGAACGSDIGTLIATNSTFTGTTHGLTLNAGTLFDKGFNTYSDLTGTNTQPTCAAAIEGWQWFLRGTGAANAVRSTCQNQSGAYTWVTY